MALKRAGFEKKSSWSGHKILTAKTIESAALALKSVDDVHGSHRLSLSVLGVSDGIPDDVLKENLEHSTGLFVDETRDTLDTTSARKPADCWLGNALNVVTQNLPVALCSTLAKTLASFAASRHLRLFLFKLRMVGISRRCFYTATTAGPLRKLLIMRMRIYDSCLDPLTVSPPKKIIQSIMTSLRT